MSAAHLHLILVHVPVLFIPLALLLLAAGLRLKQQSLSTLALGLFIFSAAISIPTFLSGEPSEEQVEDLPLVSESHIEEHEEAAELAFYVTLLAGALSVGSLIVRKQPDYQKLLIASVLFTGALSSVALARAAYLGGQIRHSEIRSGQTVSNSHEVEKRAQKEDDDD